MMSRAWDLFCKAAVALIAAPAVLWNWLRYRVSGRSRDRPPQQH